MHGAHQRIGRRAGPIALAQQGQLQQARQVVRELPHQGLQHERGPRHIPLLDALERLQVELGGRARRLGRGRGHRGRRHPGRSRARGPRRGRLRGHQGGLRTMEGLKFGRPHAHQPLRDAVHLHRPQEEVTPRGERPDDVANGHLPGCRGEVGEHVAAEDELEVPEQIGQGTHQVRHGEGGDIAHPFQDDDLPLSGGAVQRKEVWAGVPPGPGAIGGAPGMGQARLVEVRAQHLHGHARGRGRHQTGGQRIRFLAGGAARAPAAQAGGVAAQHPGDPIPGDETEVLRVPVEVRLPHQRGAHDGLGERRLRVLEIGEQVHQGAPSRQLRAHHALQGLRGDGIVPEACPLGDQLPGPGKQQWIQSPRHRHAP
ncbi:hypothetical protein STIAU_8104 [Stigmatella aurantiaca DW4/3-1]|uniref:Uncharacterized protein n=1 Tax=Stigmatella aurantiaca (strain DW4/3-1) TaxID=378806 RepID=Q08XU1_STIAD|nr:hypothetical protein STIAU_8104 [Stigmatella aurantiaca DW4/3-1]